MPQQHRPRCRRAVCGGLICGPLRHPSFYCDAPRNVITSGAGCSIISTAAVSITGVTGCFTFRATFFTGAGFGLAFAGVGFVRFAAFDGLRALPRTVAAFLFCAFDTFLRLAMIDPLSPSGAPHRIDAGSASPGNLSNELSTDGQLECAQAGAILYSVGLGRPSAAERKVGTKVKFAASLHCPVRQPDGMLSENTARGGTKAKPSGASAAPTALLFV